MTATATLPDDAAPAGSARIISGRHFPELDGIRGLAILMVMVFHMTTLAPVTALERGWCAITQFGGSGVDLFFVLSGFLITGILHDARQSSRYFRNFYARRTLRIFPLYYAIVAFSFLVLPHIPNVKAAKFGSVGHDAAWYWLYLSNFAIAARGRFTHGILDVSWSLSIEEQFYLVWPAVVLLFEQRALMRICIALAGVALASRLILYGAGVGPVAIGVLTCCRCDGLALGGFVALLVRGERPARFRAPAAYAGCAAAVAVVFLASPLSYPGHQALEETVQGTFIALVAAAMIYRVVTATRPTLGNRLLRVDWLKGFGRYSYALYLFHYPVMAAIRDTVYGPAHFMRIVGSVLPGQIIFYAAGISISYVAAWLSWHLFESHFIKLKGYFPATPTAARDRNGGKLPISKASMPIILGS